ncbi:hypothetical protein EDB85DRAFT_2156205 [Lactarius pseudohatsudake]|nr:hypothetical protein EDB85DRAFT_2156205 [Lactarius pseudohatsudake]
MEECNHPLISTPWTRIDLALAFISGPTTLAWRRSIRCSRTTEVTTDTLWDDFLEFTNFDSECPITVPAEASTLKRVEDISIILATDKLSPRCLLETIDLTADDDEADDWSLFAPRVPAPPPRNPRALQPALASPHIRSASPIVPVTTRDSSSDPPLPLIETPDLSTTASAAQRAEERPVAIPVDVDHVTSPHASNGTTRKRKHKTDEEDDTRPSKRVHAQLARRSIPLPRKYRYVQRRPTVPPPPVNDSSGRPALNVASLLPLSSPDDDKPVTVSVAVVSPLQRPRTVSPDPSPSTALSAPTCVPSLPFPPTPRCVSPSGVRTPSPVALLALSPILDGFPRPSSPAVFALPVDDINDAAKAFLFPSRLPSPFLAPAPSSALPPTSIVEDDNSLRRGVKTLGASVFAPDFVVSPVTTSPTNNLDSSIEALDSPLQHQNQRKFAMPTTNDDYRALFAPHHPVTPATVPVSPSADHVNNKRTPHNDAPVQPRSPRHPHIFPPNPCKRPRDLDKPTAESTHAQPQQARSCQAPRPIDRRIKDEQPPDALAKRRAVNTFLKNYDVNKTVQKPTPVEDDREYNAVAQHLDRWLQMTDRQYRSHPFCLHHAKIQHAMIEPRQSTNAKMNKTELPRHSQQPRSHSPGHIRKARICHALTHEERQRYHTENFDSG